MIQLHAWPFNVDGLNPSKTTDALLWALPGGSHLYTPSLCDPGSSSPSLPSSLWSLYTRTCCLYLWSLRFISLYIPQLLWPWIKILCYLSSTVAMWLPLSILDWLQNILYIEATENWVFLHWWKENETHKQQLIPLFRGHKPSVLTSLQEPACLIRLTALAVSSNPAVTAFVAPTPVISLALSSSKYWCKILLCWRRFLYILNPHYIL